MVEFFRKWQGETPWAVGSVRAADPGDLAKLIGMYGPLMPRGGKPKDTFSPLERSHTTENIWKEFSANYRQQLIRSWTISWGFNRSFTRYLVKYPGGEGLTNEHEEAYRLIKELIEDEKEGWALTAITKDDDLGLLLLDHQYGIRLPGSGTSPNVINALGMVNPPMIAFTVSLAGQQQYAEGVGRYQAPFWDAMSEYLCHFERDSIHPNWNDFKFLEPCTTSDKITAQRAKYIGEAAYTENLESEYPLRITSELLQALEKENSDGNDLEARAENFLKRRKDRSWEN